MKRLAARSLTVAWVSSSSLRVDMSSSKPRVDTLAVCILERSTWLLLIRRSYSRTVLDKKGDFILEAFAEAGAGGD